MQMIRVTNNNNNNNLIKTHAICACLSTSLLDCGMRPCTLVNRYIPTFQRNLPFPPPHHLQQILLGPSSATIFLEV